jgi:hypothetical protein
MKFVGDLRQVGSFIRVPQWPSRYNWNVVESDVEHHSNNPNPLLQVCIKDTIIIFLWYRYWLRTLMLSVFSLIQVFINTMIVRHGLMYLISSNIQTSIQKLSLSASMNQQEKHIMTNLQVVSMSMHNVCLLCSWNSPFSFA